MNNKYDQLVFSHVYPIIRDFLYHYIMYKEIHNTIDQLPGSKEFWVMSCDAHLKVASASWCMVFGAEKSNPTHWKKIVKNDEGLIKEFRNVILDTQNLTLNQWGEYRNQIMSFRNGFVVHREIDFEKPVPIFQLAFDIVLLFDKWIRTVIAPDYLNFDSMETLAEKFRNETKITLQDVYIR